MARFPPRIASIFAPLLIYVSAIGTLCGSIVLAGAMLLAAPPSASVATDGRAAPISAKLVRAAERAAMQPAKIKAEGAGLCRRARFPPVILHPRPITPHRAGSGKTT
jgi:hypothetical protein